MDFYVLSDVSGCHLRTSDGMWFRLPRRRGQGRYRMSCATFRDAAADLLCFPTLEQVLATQKALLADGCHVKIVRAEPDPASFRVDLLPVSIPTAAADQP
jgi:hypothetical protein